MNLLRGTKDDDPCEPNVVKRWALPTQASSVQLNAVIERKSVPTLDFFETPRLIRTYERGMGDEFVEGGASMVL